MTLIRAILESFLNDIRKIIGTDNRRKWRRAVLDNQQQILWLLKFPSPGSLFIVLKGESEDMQIQYNIQLPPLPPNSQDIDHGKLTIIINGGTPDTRDVPKDATSVDGLLGPLNATVDLSFVYVDAAGNESASPSVASVTLVDTFPPPNPGSIGITEIAEVEDTAAPSDPAAPPADSGTPPSSDPAPTDAPPVSAGDSTTGDVPPSDAPTA